VFSAKLGFDQRGIFGLDLTFGIGSVLLPNENLNPEKQLMSSCAGSFQSDTEVEGK